METISTSEQGGPSSDHLKEESGSSPQTDRGSPPPNCSICLGKCKNKCFTDSCFHQFCFKCLLQWSKIKAECPLCKQTFKSIIHNVRSNHQYDEYTVEQAPPTPEVEDMELEDMELQLNYFDSPRFRYRTTVTLHRRDSLAIQRLLTHIPESYPRVSSPSRVIRSTQRRTIYRNNLWAIRLPDITGRYRECSPEFYRNNPAQIHRLVPWLQRELMVLLPDPTRVAYVLRLITDSVPIYSITSSSFRILLMPYIGSNLTHFLHEFVTFATSPYDMVGYDRTVQYNQTPLSTYTNYSSSILSSETESNDSDIMLISTTAGPSFLPPPDQSSTVTTTQLPQDNVIAIETISHSDTDDSSSEVMVVGFIKPPQDRTPEVVDLLASDSDVVLNEPEPEPPGIDNPSDSCLPMHRDGTPPSSMVKVKLKRSLARSCRTNSSNNHPENYLSGHSRTARKRRFRDDASTSSTACDTSDDTCTFSDISQSPSYSEDLSSIWKSPPESDVYNRISNCDKLIRKTQKLKKIRNTARIRNLAMFDESTDSSTSSDFSEVKKKRIKIGRKSQNKSKKTKKKDSPKRKSKSTKKVGNSSRDVITPKKKQKLSTRNSKDSKLSSRSSKAKARHADQIKSSQKKTHLHNSTAVTNHLDEEQPSTSMQCEIDAVTREGESKEVGSKKRLKSVVNVVESPVASHGTSVNLDDSQLASQTESNNPLCNTVLHNNTNVLSYNSDSGSCTMPEDVPLKFLFPTFKESCDNLNKNK